MNKSIFAKIIDRELPADILFEDDDIICIKDKFPQAPIHILLITKKQIPSIQQIEESDYPLVVKIFKKAKDLATTLGIEDSYRIVTNHGQDAGQTVFHLHFHLLGGKKLGAKGA